jgi:hypothetical protein
MTPEMLLLAMLVRAAPEGTPGREDVKREVLRRIEAVHFDREVQRMLHEASIRRELAFYGFDAWTSAPS